MLYLLPTTLGEANQLLTIPAEVLVISQKLKHFIVENERTARRYLKSIGTIHAIDDLEFFILDKRSEAAAIPQLLTPLLNGHPVGLLSEAGLPGIADPGALVVAACHRNKIKVVPCSGPSSIILALIASGFSGQQFTFHGYLPVKAKDRIQKLRTLENESRKTGATQIFMETPFRNETLFEDIMNHCSPAMELCVATDITLSTEKITTRSVENWIKHPPKIHKKPCVFLIGRSA